ncbi:MAG: T9SS type A sorting domain-containing protein [Flavobacteriaceae bacterium]|nr:T9SS type A sorting domain-containing protein [Candidatus Onthonaster equi]
MKKFYSLVAIAAASLTFAQGSETFETQTILSQSGNSYADGSFQGETSGVMVNFVHARDQAEFPISGKGIMLRRSDEPSSVEFVIPDGVGEFKFQYRKAFTSGTVRQLSVYVNGELADTTAEYGEGSGEQGQIYTFAVPVNKAGQVKVKITYSDAMTAGNRQTTIDNVSWDKNLGVADYTQAAKAIQNTVWTDTASFSTKGNAKVEVYNVNGQLVKSLEVNGNKNVNVADLAKGIYFVSSTQEGKTITTKVVKK